MESFYGGRPGVSFVIVKSFDGIKPETEEKQYSSEYFAYNYNESVFYAKNNNDDTYTLISRNADNYNKYSWRKLFLDGTFDDTEIYDVDNNRIVNNIKVVLEGKPAEYMTDCFQQGNATISEVSYGEYVLINTSDINHPDNGKVFRRGFDYLNPEKLYGAEYIGQFIGPQGESPKIKFDSYNGEIDTKGSYSTETKDLIPGATLITDDNNNIIGVDENKFNDFINYSWENLKDEVGNIYECKVGFQFPYHVFNLHASSVSPYYNRDKDNDKNFTNLFLMKQEDDKEHPYYSEWHISIPKGIKGDSVDNLKIVPGYVKKNTNYYSDKECTSLVGTLNKEVIIDFSSVNYDINNNILPININNIEYFVKNDDMNSIVHRDVVIYTKRNYDKTEEGDKTFFNIGEYNIIKDITLSTEGELTVYYSHNDPKKLEHKVQWIKQIDIANDGTFTVTYNVFNEDKTNKQDKWNKILKWISSIETKGDELTLQINFNNGDIPFVGPSLKTVKNVIFKDKVNDNGIEGSGDQRLYLEFNNNKISDAISPPINYIMKCLVTTEEMIKTLKIKYPTKKVPEPYHLLVLFSDPQRRQSYPNKVFYEEADYGSRDDWSDLGYVRGELQKSALSIYKTVNSVNDLPTEAPEIDGANNNYYGHCIAVGADEEDKTIYYYEYSTNTWKRVLANFHNNPSYIIQLANEGEAINDTLLPEGILLFSKQIKYAE